MGYGWLNIGSILLGIIALAVPFRGVAAEKKWKPRLAVSAAACAGSANASRHSTRRRTKFGIGNPVTGVLRHTHAIRNGFCPVLRRVGVRSDPRKKAGKMVRR